MLGIDGALARAARSLAVDPALTVSQARDILRVAPDNADACSLLGRALRSLGDSDAAEQAELEAIRLSTHDPVLVEAALALLDNELAVAEPLLRARLKAKPHDVAAIRLLSELAGRLGRWGDAETLLRRALELAPGFAAARANLATVLYRQNRPLDALAELDTLTQATPENMAHHNLKAAALGRIGEYDEAIALYQLVLRRFPDKSKVWMSYGHVLKTVGRQVESIAAYRRAIELAPQRGEVWWSLANLKTVRFDEADVATMEAGLARPDLDAPDRFHLHFALGKALEDARQYEASFAHYAKGNALRKAALAYDPAAIDDHVRRSAALFTTDRFRARAAAGHPATDPIFILGMPRAGSTLIEQILSSHPLIEGTSELPDILSIAKRLGQAARARGAAAYPDSLIELSDDERHALGAEYLDRTRIHRKTARPFYIDKMPNNWAHVGLIHLILPNARIIDARRHPLDCCFSNFKQHFAQGQAFSYDLDDVGSYYRNYVDYMDAVDAALPGRVLRVFHEDVIEDIEGEVRRLLDYVGVPFDPACLRFFENERAVQTASSEQVRRPISRAGVGQWRAFEPWLGRLKSALGPALEGYRASRGAGVSPGSSRTGHLNAGAPAGDQAAE